MIVSKKQRGKTLKSFEVFSPSPGCVHWKYAAADGTKQTKLREGTLQRQKLGTKAAAWGPLWKVGKTMCSLKAMTA